MAKSKTVKAIEQAEKALEISKRKHREAFRKAIAATFNEYGLQLIGQDRTDPLQIAPVAGEFDVSRLPE